MILSILWFLYLPGYQSQEISYNITGNETWLLDLSPIEQMYIYCSSNLASLYCAPKSNYNNRFTIPKDYNLNHCPDEIVDIEIGLYYNQLSFLGYQ